MPGIIDEETIPFGHGRGGKDLQHAAHGRRQTAQQQRQRARLGHQPPVRQEDGGGAVHGFAHHGGHGLVDQPLLHAVSDRFQILCKAALTAG